jgi:hypothetical protein
MRPFFVYQSQELTMPTLFTFAMQFLIYHDISVYQNHTIY